MDVTDLTPAALAELAAPRPLPAVTVAVPTHRREPENEQDALWLKNLLGEARRRIETDESLARADRLDVLAQLDQAAAEVDLRHALDGLLLFAAPGEHQVWSIPRTVPGRVVLSDTFLTRNLVAARAVHAPYWVLTLGAQQVRLWSGAGPELAQARVAGFPQLPANPEKFDPQREERIGDTPSVYRAEETKSFFRDVDTALTGLLKRDPRPLYLVGVPAAISLFDAVLTSRAALAGTLEKGGLGDGPATALAPALQPVRAAHATQRQQAVLTRLEQAAGRKTLAAGLDEVWEAVAEGRVAELVVEEDFRAAVVVSGGHLVPTTEAAGADGEVREDVVDEAVERTLQSGGEVSFVPDGTLADRQSIAAVLRY
ncbi:chemotaxis protein [Streptomyces tateyamensis]|uniref:Chemotaxis protein n=1 Tax=Streptomyces tateyamensis TaxID=565073 RepID=A0A2V4NRB0_9ACTN|nr:chemotaxis protein [Streptomyces tateyamensis]PYC78540.1 chemotaxis protein [Streptomyces tateyamensis]